MHARLTADERRDEIVAAAAIEFAGGGFAGTSAEAIARRAGVSQPYLFQLFGTKKDLFIAVVRDCFDRTGRRFKESGREARAAGLDTSGILEHMGHAYVEMLLADRNILRLQLHAYAACSDPDIRAVVRDEYLALWQTVARVSGGDPYGLHEWFAQGMLINVIASIGDARTLEEFDASMFGGVAVQH
jgi:AcrR family transcriptional regulator